MGVVGDQNTEMRLVQRQPRSEEELVGHLNQNV
jgi:hypothetical protein